jgi:hypothetical protein
MTKRIQLFNVITESAKIERLVVLIQEDSSSKRL